MGPERRHGSADPPIPVMVDDNGGTWPGQALGWRGERVYVTYSSGVGLRHLTWVAAGQVRRRSALDAG
ncbi:MAG: hypothetical protein NVS3B18_01720 [Candidatus Dormibacteria bacterium]